jgi:hypothetical protein
MSIATWVIGVINIVLTILIGSLWESIWNVL